MYLFIMTLIMALVSVRLWYTFLNKLFYLTMFSPQSLLYCLAISKISLLMYALNWLFLLHLFDSTPME